jgi:hypothetical protein
VSKFTRITTLLALATLIGGCVPFPSVHYYAPAVSGVITQDGFPVAGAEVRVSTPFVDENSVATTGTDGRFATASIREFSFVTILMGDPVCHYEIKITADGKTYEGYSDAGVGYTPETIELRCDLSLPLLGQYEEYCVRK